MSGGNFFDEAQRGRGWRSGRLDLSVSSGAEEGEGDKFL